MKFVIGLLIFCSLVKFGGCVVEGVEKEVESWGLRDIIEVRMEMVEKGE